MTDRRSFIKSSSLALTGGILTVPQEIEALANSFSTKATQRSFWDEVRQQFPLTTERVYFNNGTIGPSPYKVIEAVRNKMEHLNAWGEYSGHSDSRKPLAEFVKVKEGEICLTHNTTEGINIIASGLPLQRGDEIITTTHEHAGNALPWLNQKKQRGIVIRPFEPQNTASGNLNRINNLINSKTKVVAVPHITCTTGHVMPAKEISKLGKEKGLWVFFDGAHAPGSVNLDLGDMDCDFYASCGHKWMLGPSGTGFLFVKKELQDTVKPMSIGAYSDTGWEISKASQTLDGYVPTAHRYDYGTQSTALTYGLLAAMDFLNGIGMEKVEAYSCGLSDRLYKGLQDLGDPVELLTPFEEKSRSTMVTFRISGMDYKAFGEEARNNKFRIRLVPESGLEAIRISTHIYNNTDEVDRFVEMVSKLVKS
jgi:selenocysteine lyase/cysteine desulfurase